MINKLTQLIANRSVVFSTITYLIDVKPAAAYENYKIKKRVTANVQLFSKVAVNVYENAVKKSAKKYPNRAIDDFKASDNYYEHSNNCFSVVKHKEREEYYLYVIFNRVISSEYFINGIPASKEDVLNYLTPSAVAALEKTTQYNVTNQLTHNVIVRVIKFENIEQIKTCGYIIKKEK